MNKKCRPRTKKGNMVLMWVFMITSILVICICALFAPMGVIFLTQSYAAGEDSLLQAKEMAGELNNTDVRDAIIGYMDGATAHTQDNVNIGTSMFKYGWIFILVISVMILVLYGRQLVEYQRGGIA